MNFGPKTREKGRFKKMKIPTSYSHFISCGPHFIYLLLLFFYDNEPHQGMILWILHWIVNLRYTISPVKIVYQIIQRKLLVGIESRMFESTTHHKLHTNQHLDRCGPNQLCYRWVLQLIVLPLELNLLFFFFFLCCATLYAWLDVFYSCS